MVQCAVHSTLRSKGHDCLTAKRNVLRVLRRTIRPCDSIMERFYSSAGQSFSYVSVWRGLIARIYIILATSLISRSSTCIRCCVTLALLCPCMSVSSGSLQVASLFSFIPFTVERFYLVFWPDESTYNILPESKIVGEKEPLAGQIVK